MTVSVSTFRKRLPTDDSPTNMPQNNSLSEGCISLCAFILTYKRFFTLSLLLAFIVAASLHLSYKSSIYDEDETVSTSDLYKGEIFIEGKKFLVPDEEMDGYVDSDIRGFVDPFFEYAKDYRLAPRYQLSACQIPKSLSTIQAAVVCYLYDPDEFIERGREITKESYYTRFCAKKNEVVGTHKLLEKMGTNNFTRVAVVREPIDRFISGFVDKCLNELKNKPTNNRCYNCGDDVKCFLREQYRRFREISAGIIRGRNYIDGHFAPQNWLCDFRHDYWKYKIVRYGSRDQNGKEAVNTFVDDYLNVLRGAGVEEERIEYIEKAMTKGKSPTTTYGSDMHKKISDKVRKDKQILRMINRIYYYDFVLFGFPMDEIPVKMRSLG